MSPLFKRVNHIGIVVKNLDEVLRFYSTGMGVKNERIVEIPDSQLRIGIITLADMEIEFLEYRDCELPIVKSLKGDRTGLNHICFEVEDFEKTLRKLKESGFELIKGFPRKGVHGRIAFFIPPYASEERIEILEMGSENESILAGT